jgi:signal recognition particle subunit SRP54
MGNLKDLMSMIPGIGKSLKNMEMDDNAFNKVEAMIYSMTPKERSNPSILNVSRRRRIASGSGTTLEDVNRLIKQFEMACKMMRQMASVPGNQSKMMQLQRLQQSFKR